VEPGTDSFCRLHSPVIPNSWCGVQGLSVRSSVAIKAHHFIQPPTILELRGAAFEDCV
jgi:hypothetical protein